MREAHWPSNWRFNAHANMSISGYIETMLHDTAREATASSLRAIEALLINI